MLCHVIMSLTSPSTANDSALTHENVRYTSFSSVHIVRQFRRSNAGRRLVIHKQNRGSIIHTASHVFVYGYNIGCTSGLLRHWLHCNASSRESVRPIDGRTSYRLGTDIAASVWAPGAGCGLVPDNRDITAAKPH